MQKNIPKLEYHTEEYKQLVYGRWLDLKAECGNNNSNNPAVTMDQAWFDDFNLFFIWCVKQGFNRGYALRRRDPNSSWGPDNCYLNAISKATAKQYVYKGKSHTLSEWAAITGISQDILNSRIREGWTLEEAFHSVPKTVNRKSAQYCFNGEYHSIPEWAEIINVAVSQLYSRAKYLRDHGKATDDLLMIVPAYIARQLKKQISSEQPNEKQDVTSDLLVEAIAAEKAEYKKNSAKRYKFFDEELTIPEWSKRLNVPSATMYTFAKKLKDQGKETSDLLDILPEYIASQLRESLERNPELNPLTVDVDARLYTYNGETHTIPEWSKITGIDKGTLYKRLKLGWSIGRVLSVKVRKKMPMKKKEDQHVLTYKGGTHTLKEWEEITGINRTTIMTRIERGWTVRRALTAPVNPLKQKKSKNSILNTVEYNGETHTIKEWSEILGMNVNTLRDRLARRGWSVERAFTEPIKYIPTNRFKSSDPDEVEPTKAPDKWEDYRQQVKALLESKRTGDIPFDRGLEFAWFAIDEFMSSM